MAERERLKFPLLIKFPSRSRPQLFASTFARWNAAPEAVRFVVSIDSDDTALPAYLEFLNGKPNVRVAVGASPNKVHAINRDLDGEEWDVLVCAADDMIPQRADYAAEIMRLMRLHFPDGDGVLHLNDGRAGKQLNTLPVVGKTYYDRTGYLYHPSYASVYCDNEAHEVAESLCRQVYVPEVLVRHAWIDATGRDELHRRNESSALYVADKATYERRKAAGWPE